MFLPFLLCGLAGVGVLLALGWRHRRISRAAACPEVQVAASWWNKTITAMARSERYRLDEASQRTFKALIARLLGKAYLKDGYYPMLSTKAGRMSRELRTAIEGAGFSYNWIPVDVVMCVFPDSITLKCGSEREDRMQIIWTPAA